MDLALAHIPLPPGLLEDHHVRHGQQLTAPVLVDHGGRGDEQVKPRGRNHGGCNSVRIVPSCLCRYIPRVSSSCGSMVLVEETAKAIAALHSSVRRRGHPSRFARPALAEALVGRASW